MAAKIKYGEALQQIEALQDAPPGSKKASKLRKIVKAVVEYHKKQLSTTAEGRKV